MVNKRGERNGYDSWTTCRECLHEHWTGYIVSEVTSDRVTGRSLCKSCVNEAPCVDEPGRDVIRA